MAVEGTVVHAENVEGGVALNFTTSGDIAELRTRVAHMAKMHGPHGDGVKVSGWTIEEHTHGGQRADGGQYQDGSMGGGTTMPETTGTSEEIEGGARLILIPQHVVELEKLREHVSHMTKKTSTGRRRMMSMHGQPSDPSSQAAESNFPEQNGSAY